MSGARLRHKPTNPLRSDDWDVRSIDPMVGRAIIARHHYAGGCSNTTVACHGLINRSDGRIAGVAWWLPPTGPAARAAWYEPNEVLSLSRLVILPDAPTNAATFLLMRSVRLLDPRWKCLVTWADTERGHTGAIYRAAGWEYLYLSNPTDVWVDAQGRRVTRKVGPKTRTHADMRDLGHVFLGYFAKHRFRFVRRRFVQRDVWRQLELIGDVAS